jgi:hypothetical protein
MGNVVVVVVVVVVVMLNPNLLTHHLKSPH